MQIFLQILLHFFQNGSKIIPQKGVILREWTEKNNFVN